jgi:alpha-mannosidase
MTSSRRSHCLSLSPPESLPFSVTLIGLQVQKDFQEISRNIRAVPYPVWRGELYLELHQGTFTSQAKIKAQNRTCEMLLRGLEALHAMALLGTKRKLLTLPEDEMFYIASLSEKIVSLWKDTLLNQFHDVIREFSPLLLTLPPL